MLHSFQYYACYYALLCLLHHQQQAASLTIIIDGATTNEWATRDEYQKLVESSSGPAPSDQAPALAGSGPAGGPPPPPQPQQLQQQQQEQQELAATPTPEEELALAEQMHSQRLRMRATRPQYFCGKKLMEILELVCEGRFYSGESEPETVNPAIKTKRFVRNNDIRNKHSKMALYRRVRGASEECCSRPCYMEELKPYCKT